MTEAELFAFAVKSLAARGASVRQLEKKMLARTGAEPEARAAVGRVLEELKRIGHLDDRAFAEARARALFAKGKPRRVIEADLAAAGLDRAAIEEALEPLGDDGAAADRWLRRKRRGPYRASDRAGHRERDLAALARAGFGFAAARRAVDGEEIEATGDDLG